MFELATLYIKPQAGAPMRRVRSVTGVAGHGLVGDANADPNSPRQVLIVSEDDLRSLRLKGADLRANFVVRGDLRAVVSGSVLSFGALRIRITIPCEPCGRLNAVRPGLSGDIGPRRGLLARVVSSGDAAIGARGCALEVNAQPLASDWRERVFAILMNLPFGSTLSYAALARAAGVQTAYCRAIPSVLRTLAIRGAPVHRVVPTDASKIDPVVIRRLEKEGIDLRTDPSSYSWDAKLYYSTQETAWTTQNHVTNDAQGMPSFEATTSRRRLKASVADDMAGRSIPRQLELGLQEPGNAK